MAFLTSKRWPGATCVCSDWEWRPCQTAVDMSRIVVVEPRGRWRITGINRSKIRTTITLMHIKYAFISNYWVTWMTRPIANQYQVLSRRKPTGPYPTRTIRPQTIIYWKQTINLPAMNDINSIFFAMPRMPSDPQLNFNRPFIYRRVYIPHLVEGVPTRPVAGLLE